MIRYRSMVDGLCYWPEVKPSVRLINNEGREFYTENDFFFANRLVRGIAGLEEFKVMF